MFGKLFTLLKPFHKVFITLVLMAVIYEGGGVLGSYTVSLIVRLFELKVQFLVWVFVAFLLAAYNEGYMRLDNAWDWHIIAKQSHPIYKFLKVSALRKFLSMPITWHQRHNSGSLVGQASDGVWKALEIIDQLSWEFMPTTIQTVLSLIPLFYFSPWTAVLSLLAYGLFIVLTLKGEKEKQPFRKRRHDLYEKEWSLTAQAVQGHETVTMFGQQERLQKDQESLHNEIIGEAFNEHRLGVFKYNRARIRILTAIRLVIYGIWVNQLLSGQLDVANLIFVSVLTEKLFNSFWRFARLADQFFRNGEGVNRLLNVLLEPEPIDSGHEVAPVIGPVGIRLDQVCFAYSGDYDKNGGALHNLTLDIEPGKIVALVGPSGAGKTTVRKVVTKQIPFQGGAIEIAGLDISRWQGEELRKLFSYVPQGDDVYIWDEDVYYNIAFPRPDATVAEVKEAARLAGIHDFILTLENGYHTLVGERGVRLSGGQKQRVALARAILANRPILILDEATSAVDSITEDEIQTNMRHILAGKTAIIIAHRLSTIKNADKIVVMDGGRKVEEGSHKDLVSLAGLYAKMVALQASQ